MPTRPHTLRGRRTIAGGVALAVSLCFSSAACAGPERSAPEPEPVSGPDERLLLPELPQSIPTSRDASPAEAKVSARPANWAQPLHLLGVPNLYRVTPLLYRSGQPAQDGWAGLEGLGVRSVLSLRAFHSDRILRTSGLRAQRTSFKSWHPEDEDVLRFLRILQDPDHQPLLVHCEHGADRTGMLIAIERIVIEGWSREDAIREMVEGGFGFHPIWQNLVDYVKRVDVERLRRLAGIAAPTGVR